MNPFPAGALVAAYLRDSGHEEQDLSIEQQEAAISGFCIEHGLILATIYRDAAAPGSSTTTRSAFNDMIAHFRAPNCPETGILIWKYNRFARSMEDAQFYKADLRRRGYIIHAINDQIPEGLNGRFFESAIDWMNARYLEDLRIDVKRGQHHLIEQHGALGGTPPRGFIRQPIQLGDRRDGAPHIVHRWIPDPNMAETIRTAWQMRAAGATYATINTTCHLYKSTGAYERFFRNRIYIGELEFSGEIIPDYCPALITPHTWDAVQILQETSRTKIKPDLNNPSHPRRIASSYLLSGIAICNQCGSLLSGDTVQFKSTSKYCYHYYACSGQNRHSGCTARKIPAETLENIVLDQIANHALNPEVIAAQDPILRDNQAEYDRTHKQKIIEINQRIGIVRRKIDNLTDVIAERGTSARSLVNKINELESEETALKTEKTRLNKSPRPALDINRIQASAAIIRSRLATADPETLRTIVLGLVASVKAELDLPTKTIIGQVELYLPPEDIFMPKGQCPGHVTDRRHKIYIPLSSSVAIVAPVANHPASIRTQV